MTPYIRFCSMQLKASSLIQYKYDNNPDFKFSVKVIINIEYYLITLKRYNL